MLIKCTEIMTKAIRKELKARNIDCVSCVELYKFTPENYGIYCGSIWENEIDFNPATGKISAIVITYTPEELALEKILTTHELNRLFNQSDKTYSGCFDELAAAVEG